MADTQTTDTHGVDQQGWIGVDLDGTLAHYDGWKGIEHIGAPIPRMVERVKQWLAEGKRVKIMTARVAPRGEIDITHLAAKAYIRKWLIKVFGPDSCELTITHEKDAAMIELWDDRCKQVWPNTGTSVEESYAQSVAQSNKFLSEIFQLREEIVRLRERITGYKKDLNRIALGQPIPASELEQPSDEELRKANNGELPDWRNRQILIEQGGVAGI